MSVVSVYAVFANAEEAERIGCAVVEARLAACVNILGPCRSIYRWQGEVQSSEEVAAIFKTTDAAADALLTRIAGLHIGESQSSSTPTPRWSGNLGGHRLGCACPAAGRGNTGRWALIVAANFPARPRCPPQECCGCAVATATAAARRVDRAVSIHGW